MIRNVSLSRRRLILVVSFAVLTVVGGCGSDDPTNHGESTTNNDENGIELTPVVGEPCSEDGECEQTCLTGYDWPHGMCTVGCLDDTDCPDHGKCVDILTGVCMMDCSDEDDCRAGYSCEIAEREGHHGYTDVCLEG